MSEAKEVVNFQLNIKHVLSLQHKVESKHDSLMVKIKKPCSPGSRTGCQSISATQNNDKLFGTKPENLYKIEKL